MHLLTKLPSSIRQYLLITANYWAFTLTDGALRMLVVLHFYQLGYSPLNIALLFLFYEIFGVITNLFGGWLGAYIGLNKTMNIGLGLQVFSLCLLLVPSEMLTLIWVMAAQALSGIAKDLNKMSAKSSLKLLIPKDAEGTLYKWVALLTGSKNTLKGLGFFLGGALLSLFGFKLAIGIMALGLSLIWLLSLFNLKQDLGKMTVKPKFKQLFSKSRRINLLSAARLFLFAARDVWFVIALPVFLASQFKWDHITVGSFLAIWVIGYGLVQSIAPYFTSTNIAVNNSTDNNFVQKQNSNPDGKTAFIWAACLVLIPVLIAISLDFDIFVKASLILGLMIFGFIFAINSSLHSYLILSYARADGVSLDVGFYYMANAMGRLIGTLLSGWLFQSAGLIACLWVSAIFILLAAIISSMLPVGLSKE